VRYRLIGCRGAGESGWGVAARATSKLVVYDAAWRRGADRAIRARTVVGEKRCPGADHILYDFFRPDRGFLMPLWTERLLGKPIVFALNNAWAKYYQVGRKAKRRPA
jgi:hypothetical protein